MRQLLMCPPYHFDVKYDINPWMSNNLNFVNNDEAKSQWNLLYGMLRSCANVQLVDPIKKLPDMVFTANAGFQFNGKNVVLSRFRHKERQGEEEVFQNWFENHGYTVHTVNDYFEGQGDILRDADGRIWLGTGLRTTKLVVNELETIIGEQINVLELKDNRWYHLDTCFCPLPHGELLWYPEAFTNESQDLIYDSFEDIIEVTEEDALRFACNTVCVLDNVFTPTCSDELSVQLLKYGYNHQQFPMKEFLKAGGAVKCLVMDLDELR